MRKAFTLIELSVVLFVIGVLIALLFPAVQRTREVARQVQCINNQKQLALALHLHENTRNGLPGWRDFVTVVPPDGIAAPNYEDGDEFAAQASWVFILLPYIEQTELFDRLRTGQVLIPDPFANSTEIPPIPTLLCRSHTGGFAHRATNYVVNGGAVDNFSDNFYVDSNVANGPFLDRAGLTVQNDRNNRHNVVRLADISRRDGAAYTFLTSENLQRGYWISRELVHFYNDRSGGDTSPEFAVDRLQTAFGVNDWELLIDDRSGRRRWVVFGENLSLTDQGFTIEGSVAFCWPRDPNTGFYPQLGGLNPYQGFWGLNANPSPDLREYVPPDGTGMIPVFPNLFRDHAFPASWYASARPSSHHPNIFIASFADGNVRKINEDIDEQAFVSLMTTSGSQSDAGRRIPGGGDRSNFLEGYLFDARVLD
ncbi:MAG: DUF1559 domain-containing protein [Planctomycetaceae bacterium]|nr:DUF1559 domain-containing protein [Planctomycetaceae bacterium]